MFILFLIFIKRWIEILLYGFVVFDGRVLYFLYLLELKNGEMN